MWCEPVAIPFNPVIRAFHLKLDVFLIHMFGQRIRQIFHSWNFVRHNNLFPHFLLQPAWSAAESPLSVLCASPPGDSRHATASPGQLGG